MRLRKYLGSGVFTTETIVCALNVRHLRKNPILTTLLLQLTSPYPQREDPWRRFNLTNSDYRPKSEELTRTWQIGTNRTVTRSMETQTPGAEERGGAVTSWGTKTRPPLTPVPGQVARWAIVTTTSELGTHEMVQIVLDQGAVTLSARVSWVFRIDKRTSYTSGPANNIPARLHHHDGPEPTRR